MGPFVGWLVAGAARLLSAYVCSLLKSPWSQYRHFRHSLAIVGFAE